MLDTSVRRTPQKSTDTRESLMLVAERLFGELGIDAVPLRMIAKEAGQGNTNSVQYHFGTKQALMRAIFDFREAQLNPVRKAMLESVRGTPMTRDVRFLLRVIHEPNFLHYRDGDGIDFLKLHVQYLSSQRPRGVTHPFDEGSASTEGLRAAADLLRERLSFLNEQLFMFRLESTGAMFLSAMIHHCAKPPAKRLSADVLYNDVLEMMTAAFTSPADARSGAVR